MKAVIAIIVGNALFGMLMWGYQSYTGVSGAAMTPVLVLTALAFSSGIFLGMYVARPEGQPKQAHRARSRNAATAELLNEIR